jgi:hypothetical protein
MKDDAKTESSTEKFPDGIDLMKECVQEIARIESFRNKCLLSALDLVRRMQSLQKTILSEYGASALFEEQYTYDTAVSHLADSILSLMKMLRCMEAKHDSVL